MSRSDLDAGGRPPQPGQPGVFPPLLDAQAASRLLGVPHTWLLKEAREGRIPHHRLGRYVRFDPIDLKIWLRGNRRIPHDSSER